MKKAYVALCLAIMACTAQAQYLILGAGAASCGKLIADKDKSHLKIMYDSWISGYLTGASAATNTNLLGGYDVDAVVAAVDKYCRENPLKKVEEACQDVVIQIVKTKK